MNVSKKKKKNHHLLLSIIISLHLMHSYCFFVMVLLSFWLLLCFPPLLCLIKAAGFLISRSEFWLLWDLWPTLINMGLFSKRGSLNLSKAEASNQVHDQIDPKFEKPDNQLDTWTYSVEDDTVETELSFGNSHRVVQDGDEDPPGWSGVTASMDDAGSMNFIPGIATDPKGGVTDFGDRSKGCCANCRYSCKIAFRPCTTKHNPLPHNPSRWKRFKFAFLCPPHGIVGRTLTCLILVLLLWAVLFTITGAEALPGGNLFGLYVLIISSIVLGLLVNKILRLPALLGKS